MLILKIQRAFSDKIQTDFMKCAYLFHISMSRAECSHPISREHEERAEKRRPMVSSQHRNLPGNRWWRQSASAFNRLWTVCVLTTVKSVCFCCEQGTCTETEDICVKVSLPSSINFLPPPHPSLFPWRYDSRCIYWKWFPSLPPPPHSDKALLSPLMR